MPDIRCPNCGELNPSNRDLCKFCYTRLKPTGELPPSSSEDLLSLLGSQEAQGEVPDWLAGLRPEDQSAPFEEGMEAEEETEFSAGVLPEEPASEQASTAMPFGEETEDWLSQLETPPFLEEAKESAAFSEGAAEEEVPSIQAYEETLDWLSRLDEQPATPGAEAEEPAPLGFFEEEMASDWFGSTQASEQPSFEAQPLEQFAETPEEEPWLTELKSEFAPQGETEEPEAEPLDWLSRLGGEEAQPPPESSQEAAAFEATSFQEAPPPFTEVSFPAEEEAEALPDWFSQAAEMPETSAPVSSEGAAFVSPFTEGVEEFLEGDQSLDWFSGVEEPVEQPRRTEDEELPDWLRQAGEGETPFVQEQESPPLEQAQQTFASGTSDFGEEVPDWLSEAAQSPFETRPVADELATGAQFATFDTEGEALPDWLTRLDMGAAPPASGSVPAFIPDEELPPFGEETPASTFEQAGAETPDWLEQITTGQELPPIESVEAQAQPVEEELTPAELPSWLEAIRPAEGQSVGVPFQDLTDDRVEQRGFLAGLSGVLSAEYDLGQVRKPPAYSLKMQIPPDQQERVDLLKALLAEEEQVAAPAKPAAMPTALILRLIILGAFVLGAIFAFWAGVQQTPVPDVNVIPQPVLDLNQIMSNLPANAPVLLAFDYEPGSVPELEAAALGVVEQLTSRGNIIRTISTTQMGPALARRMLDKALAISDRTAQPPLEVAHLGYIPGGASGLQAFARQPAALMRYDIHAAESSEMDAWRAPQFNPELGLANFKMVLVIADNADSARGWIEQVGGELQKHHIPLIMIVSAQIEPMVLPYYYAAPRQVAGLATGVMGGVFLERLSGRVGPAALLMDAFSLTQAVAVVLIFIGSLVYLISGRMQVVRNLRSEAQS